MSVETKVTCDTCGRDLTETSGQENYALRVSVRIIPQAFHENFMTTGYITPPIEKPLDFCGVVCMKAYEQK